jgi:hypothetical protein
VRLSSSNSKSTNARDAGTRIHSLMLRIWSCGTNRRLICILGKFSKDKLFNSTKIKRDNIHKLQCATLLSRSCLHRSSRSSCRIRWVILAANILACPLVDNNRASIFRASLMEQARHRSLPDERLGRQKEAKTVTWIS